MSKVDNMSNQYNTHMYSCVIPLLVQDYIANRKFIYHIFDRISIDRLIFIGPKELEEFVIKDSVENKLRNRIEFMDENDLLPYKNVKASYERRIRELVSDDVVDVLLSRAGWYYQQFLKLEFHRVCQDEYYLVWDADTIPLRNIEMFNDMDEPFLDVKIEYNKPYFDTLFNLFGIKKVIEKSFISEHMLFKKEYVKEMLDEIMSCQVDGDTYYAKIFSAIDSPALSSFSEFETYGTWVATRHLGSYRLRDWKSIRYAGYFVSIDRLTNDDIEWLATGFDAATFERYHREIPQLKEMFRNSIYRSKLSADLFYRDILEMNVFGLYRDGGIHDGINIYSV